MNLDVAVFLWGGLVAIIVAAGILTGEWKEKFFDTRPGRRNESE